jgi:hypothetical protein
MEIKVDVERLRERLVDECGVAAFNGSPAAMFDAWDVERMGGNELCEKAEELAIDLNHFRVH